MVRHSNSAALLFARYGGEHRFLERKIGLDDTAGDWVAAVKMHDLEVRKGIRELLVEGRPISTI